MSANPGEKTRQFPHHGGDEDDPLAALGGRDRPHGYAGLDHEGKLSSEALPPLARGPRGEKGERGETGFPGDQGDRGLDGPAGPPGPRGPSGDKGEKGDTGQTGDRGQTGAPGPQGPRGMQGVDGPPGPQGPRGTAPDLSAYVRLPDEPKAVGLNDPDVAHQLAYALAELGLIRLV